MPLKIIHGTYHVVGYSPDGDSIRFLANDLDLFRSLSGPRPVKLNSRNHAQLRIEAIDSLETHYSAAGGVYHQPLAAARTAANELMQFLGITDVQWDAAGQTVVSANDSAPGHILARSVEKNGRPVAFVFAGDPPVDDGSDVFFDTALLGRSYNHFALATGLAYATYYTGLFHDLRESLTTAADQARQAGSGLYAIDATTTGVSGASLRAITEEAAIMPKLFRRLTEYIVSTGSAAGFKQAMAVAAEPVLDLVTSNFTHFDTFIEETGPDPTIYLTRRPEQLVFDEMIAQPTNAFAIMMGNADEPIFADQL